MQARRNKILSIILLALITVAALLLLVDEDVNQLDVEKDKFAFADPSAIDKVVLAQPTGDVELVFQGNEWIVNGKYEADPQRIKVLFAIIKQVSIRRKVARQDADSLRQAIQNRGITATFYANSETVHQLQVLGNEQQGLTYITKKDEDIFLVEIPGYRSYLAGIFELDANAWRDPLVFDVNWRNLQQVSMIIPESPESGFDIVYDGGQYQIKGLAETDTTKLYNVLDDISLLYVNDYLSESEVEELDQNDFTPTATIVVEDVGQNKYTMEVLQELDARNVYLIRKDSTDYAILDREKLIRVLRPKRYFEVK